MRVIPRKGKTPLIYLDQKREFVEIMAKAYMRYGPIELIEMVADAAQHIIDNAEEFDYNEEMIESTQEDVNRINKIASLVGNMENWRKL